jgi:hypothetical protein
MSRYNRNKNREDVRTPSDHWCKSTWEWYTIIRTGIQMYQIFQGAVLFYKTLLHTAYVCSTRQVAGKMRLGMGSLVSYVYAYCIISFTSFWYVSYYQLPGTM